MRTWLPTSLNHKLSSTPDLSSTHGLKRNPNPHHDRSNPTPPFNINRDRPLDLNPRFSQDRRPKISRDLSPPALTSRILPQLNAQIPIPRPPPRPPPTPAQNPPRPHPQQ